MNLRILLQHLLVTTALCATAPGALAQDSLERRQTAADRYLRIVPVARMLDDTFVEIAKQLPPDQRAQFIAQMKVAVRADMIERVSRQSMVKTFTADEINALADFYGSRNGASVMRKFGLYMGEVLPVLQQEIQQAMQQVQAGKK